MDDDNKSSKSKLKSRLKPRNTENSTKATEEPTKFKGEEDKMTSENPNGAELPKHSLISNFKAKNNEDIMDNVSSKFSKKSKKVTLPKPEEEKKESNLLSPSRPIKSDMDDDNKSSKSKLSKRKNGVDDPAKPVAFKGEDDDKISGKNECGQQKERL